MSDPVDDAIQAGKILPRSADRYRRLLAVNPEGTKRTLAKLYPCLPPPDARPQAAAPEDDSYPKDWLNQPPRGSIAFEDPGLQAQAAQQQPSRVTVVND